MKKQMQYIYMKNGYNIATMIVMDVFYLFFIILVISFPYSAYDVFFGIVLFFLLPYVFSKTYEQYKNYKIWKEELKFYKLNGIKYIGKIIRTEISVNNGEQVNSYNYPYQYYAVIEYENNKGEKVTFTTPELDGNPEYLTTKEVTVYSFDSVNYATDFGYINKPKEGFWDNYKN
ncbi:MAG: hypothetical protein CVU97_06010 [Firmicutes bacterium HGW-Firmicutes-21]|nr:MAG: hypothetical protein CVU97_06010 [Firmicutes bacterium HGW-Firmicutes-21]